MTGSTTKMFYPEFIVQDKEITLDMCFIYINNFKIYINRWKVEIDINKKVENNEYNGVLLFHCYIEIKRVWILGRISLMFYKYFLMWYRGGRH